MWILYLLGLILGIWAVIKMVLVSKLRVTPGIAQGSKLVTDGPYKYVRHPMYSGVLLAGLSLVINYPNILRVIILAILVVDLVIKMNYEEILLKIYFSDYKVYKRFTWKLIPYLY
jgi:protein-S-isoprenylcysteine O-methyltransferase Ste14